jgi:sulfur-oxidizing protein SoxA
VCALSAIAVIGAGAQAQKSAADGIAEYRKMLEDGNPAELFEAKGEALWKQKRGPKNASLERMRRSRPATLARARAW